MKTPVSEKKVMETQKRYKTEKNPMMRKDGFVKKGKRSEKKNDDALRKRRKMAINIDIGGVVHHFSVKLKDGVKIKRYKDSTGKSDRRFLQTDPQRKSHHIAPTEAPTEAQTDKPSNSAKIPEPLEGEAAKPYVVESYYYDD